MDTTVGRITVALLIAGVVGAGIATAISSFFEGLPWWVSVAIFLALLFYGVCLASFEEVQEVEQERTELQGTLANCQNRELDAYHNEMQRLLLDRGLRSAKLGDSASNLAHEHTITALEKLGPKQKRSVLQLLKKAGLIRWDSAIVPLSGANFSNADLAYMHLVDTNLAGANFSKADLTGAQFHGWGGTLPELKEVSRRGTHYLGFAAQRDEGIPKLTDCRLNGAVLDRANLIFCEFGFADLESASLDRADLRGAKLSVVDNLTQEQIGKAYGSCGHKKVADTELPEGLEAPPSWRESIDEQIEFLGAKSE